MVGIGGRGRMRSNWEGTLIHLGGMSGRKS